MSFQRVTHVLFDMDGLLLNTEDIYTDVFQSITSRYGKDYTFDLKVKLMGTQALETARILLEELNIPLTPEQFMNECKCQFQVLFPQTKLLPGVRELILHLHKSKVSFGLASSSSQESYDLKVTKNHQDLFSLFPHITLGSDPEVKRGKPFPDIFLVALDKFEDKPKAEQCLVFEDAVNGVKAARAAGMQVVMIPDPRLDRSLTSEATLVLKSMKEFRPELFGLPPFP